MSKKTGVKKWGPGHPLYDWQQKQKREKAAKAKKAKKKRKST